MSQNVEDLLTKIRLGWKVERIYMLLCRMCRSGLTRSDYLMLQVPEIHIESLERTAWTKGTPVSSFGKNVHYKVYDAGKIIGASEGIDTPYIRVECSQGVIDGHPITKKEYLKRLGAI